MTVILFRRSRTSSVGSLDGTDEAVCLHQVLFRNHRALLQAWLLRATAVSVLPCTGASAVSVLPCTGGSAVSVLSCTGGSAVSVLSCTGGSAVSVLSCTGASAVSVLSCTGGNSVSVLPCTGSSAVSVLPYTGGSSVSVLPCTGGSAVSVLPCTGPVLCACFHVQGAERQNMFWGLWGPSHTGRGLTVCSGARRYKWAFSP